MQTTRENDERIANMTLHSRDELVLVEMKSPKSGKPRIVGAKAIGELTIKEAEID